MNKYRWAISASHYVTWFLGKNFPELVPLCFVTGYPKSGTVWVTQMLADYLQIPFPRLSVLPIGCEAVVHGHQAVSPKFRRGAYVMRDGRDTMVSLYFHLSQLIPEGDNPQLSARQRRQFPGLVNKADIKQNLPAFIEQQMQHPDSTGGLNWSDHIRSFYDANVQNIALLKYEELLALPATTLGAAVEVITGEEVNADRIEATVQKFSFANQTGRKNGNEDRTSFLRKGKAGDWKNHFTREAAEVFQRYCGEIMQQTGYIQDSSWIDTCETVHQKAA